jgi:hypothetical protein
VSERFGEQIFTRIDPLGGPIAFDAAGVLSWRVCEVVRASPLDGLSMRWAPVAARLRAQQHEGKRDHQQGHDANYPEYVDIGEQRRLLRDRLVDQPDRGARYACGRHALPCRSRLTTQAAVHPVVIFLIGVLDFTRSSETLMSYMITGTDSAGALSLKRDSAAAAIKKAIELMGDGCRDVCITDPNGRVYGYVEFDQLHAV